MSDFTSYGAPVPRKAKLVQGMAKDRGRIRWLEVNKKQVVGPGAISCGLAQYFYDLWIVDPPEASSSFEPDITLMGADFDTIDLTPDEDAQQLLVPPDWMWWATVAFSIDAPDELVPGDTMEWAAFAPYGGSTKSETLTGGPQSFQTTVHGMSGDPSSTYYLHGGPGYAGPWSTALGTEFVPQGMSIIMQGLSPLPCTYGYILV